MVVSTLYWGEEVFIPNIGLGDSDSGDQRRERLSHHNKYYTLAYGR